MSGDFQFVLKIFDRIQSCPSLSCVTIFSFPSLPEMTAEGNPSLRLILVFTRREALIRRPSFFSGFNSIRISDSLKFSKSRHPESRGRICRKKPVNRVLY